MIMDFVNAIADKLKELYPDKKTYFKEVPQGIDGNFAIKVVSLLHHKSLDRRRIRDLTFDIMYFLKGHDEKEYLSWADTMTYELELLLVGDKFFHCKDFNANIVDRVGHLTFSVTVNALLEKEITELMAAYEIEVNMVD